MTIPEFWFNAALLFGVIVAIPLLIFNVFWMCEQIEYNESTFKVVSYPALSVCVTLVYAYITLSLYFEVVNDLVYS